MPEVPESQFRFLLPTNKLRTENWQLTTGWLLSRLPGSLVLPAVTGAAVSWA